MGSALHAVGRRLSFAVIIAVVGTAAAPAAATRPAQTAAAAAAPSILAVLDRAERLPDGPSAADSATDQGIVAPGPGSIGVDADTVPPPPPYRVTAYTIRAIARSALPYVATSLPSKTPPLYHDADGIPMKLVGTKLYYGPAGLMQYAIAREDAYRRGGDAEYLAIASKILAKMMALGTHSNGGVYFPYRFNFAMHRISTEVMRAPWYSAMAQGLGLSLAVRLYRDTANPLFLADANLLFASFRHVGRGSVPWITYIDAGRYLWLEEYPENLTPSDHTANGFNFAIFGLYDFYEQTHDARALQILRASLTTFRHYVAQYRRPGTYSNYCLRHGRPQPKYHKIVTWQLEFLARISGDSYFHSMATLFRSDYH